MLLSIKPILESMLTIASYFMLSCLKLCLRQTTSYTNGDFSIEKFSVHIEQNVCHIGWYCRIPLWEKVSCGVTALFHISIDELHSFFRDLFIRNTGVKTLTSLVTGFTTFTSQDDIRFSTLIFFLSCCHYLTHKLYIKKLFKDSDPLNLGVAKKMNKP